MKTIKINFVGFWNGFNKTNNIFYNALSEKFDVEIHESPDFLFASPLGSPLEYLKYDCVRILFTGEPLAPDFNVFDYAIGFDSIFFPGADGKNRFYRYPLCFNQIARVRKHTQGLTRQEAEARLAEKKYFCNFIYGHRSAHGEREALLDLIQKYKRVESAGSFLNNMPDGKIVPYTEEKMEFLKQCKFTIACESISYPGFITEKIMNPFYSDSIPIYYGNPWSSTEFNSRAIINCHDYPDWQSVLDRVIEVDRNDELYIQMLMEPRFAKEHYLEEIYQGLKDFLYDICSQDKETAYRRMRHYIQAEHESYLNEYRKFHKTILYRLHKKIRGSS